MPARLIVNADDFGLTPGVNRAIAELHAAGALTSATLMATGPAFDDAVQLAARHPWLGVGCHVVLIDGRPVSPPHLVPTLLGDDGLNFRASLKDFILALSRGRVSAAELEREITAQIQFLQQAGIHVTHLDTHKHTHVAPEVAAPLLRVAEATGIRAVRNPFEEPWSLRLGQTRTLRLLAVAGTRLFRRRFLNLPQIRSGRVVTTLGTIGISATGRLNQATLKAILDALPDGTWELVCHPGYHDSDLDRITTRLRETREVERLALLNTLAPHHSSTRNSQPNQASTTHQQTLPSALDHISPHRPVPELIHYGRLAERAGPQSESGSET